MIGPEGDLTVTEKERAHRVELMYPIMRPEEIQAMKQMSYRGWETRVRVCGSGWGRSSKQVGWV